MNGGRLGMLSAAARLCEDGEVRAPRGPSMRGFQFSVRRDSRDPVPAAIDRAHRQRQYAAFGGWGAGAKPARGRLRRTGHAGTSSRRRSARCARLPLRRRPASHPRSRRHRLAAGGRAWLDRRPRRARHPRRGGGLGGVRWRRAGRGRGTPARHAGRGEAASFADHGAGLPRHDGAGTWRRCHVRARAGQGGRPSPLSASPAR